MLPLQNDRTVVLYHQQATTATNATASAAVLDTRGFEVASIEISHPPAAATNSNVKLAAFNIYQMDTTTPSTADAVAIGTTNTTASAGSFVLGVHNNTSVGGCARVTVPLVGRKRYLYVTFQPPATTSYNTPVVVARLSRSEEAPDTAAEAGVTTLHVA